MQQQVRELLTQAATVMGTEYKLAQALGISQQELSGIKYGRRPCPPDVAGVMASIADGDPVSTIIDTLMDRLSDDRRARLQRALEAAGQRARNS